MSASPSVPAPPEEFSELQQRVAGAFEKLAASATDLNAVSDELAESIRAINATLSTLNLGVSAWTQFADGSDPETETYWDRSVGYARISRKWGLAIRASSGAYDAPNEHVEEWQFNDAPRSYRLEALRVLPELLEKLAKTSDGVARKLKQRVASTKQVALTLRRMASSRANRK